jgi:hypothetical protein
MSLVVRAAPSLLILGSVEAITVLCF